MTSGVYLIRNMQTNHVYVGCSSHIEERWERHRHMLFDRQHSNRLLQQAYDAGPDKFSFHVLEVTDPMAKYTREQVWFDRMIRFHEMYNLDLSPLKLSNQTTGT